MKVLIDYAKSQLGIPYYWGGENPMQGFDCSGYVQFILRSVGMDPVGDQSAQMLYDWGKKNLFQGTCDAGALAFYGKNEKTIIHVALLINKNQVIEAGGGDHTCTTLEAASAKNACVRMRPIGHRNDLFAILMPKYPDWVING